MSPDQSFGLGGSAACFICAGVISGRPGTKVILLIRTH
jgi:hypothetical protein